MVDAISGATYHDTAQDVGYVCTGIIERTSDDGYVVVLEGLDEAAERTMAVPLDTFQTDPSFEIVDLPF